MAPTLVPKVICSRKVAFTEKVVLAFKSAWELRYSENQIRLVKTFQCVFAVWSLTIGHFIVFENY